MTARLDAGGAACRAFRETLPLRAASNRPMASPATPSLAGIH